MSDIAKAVQALLQSGKFLPPLAEIVEAVNAAYGDIVVKEAWRDLPVFDAAEIAELLQKRHRHWMSARDVFEFLGRAPTDRSESVRGGTQLKQLFSRRKQGPIAFYLIDQSGAIA
jgi:hypothetical protein